MHRSLIFTTRRLQRSPANRAELLWNLEKKYHSLPITDRIAWEAAQNPQPSDCEGDELCHLFRYEGEIKYLSVHPNGTHASEAIKNLAEALTEDVIKRANDKGGDRYAVEERVALRKLFASLRVAVAKTSATKKPSCSRSWKESLAAKSV